MPPPDQSYGSVMQTRAPDVAPPRVQGVPISGTRPRNVKKAVGLRRVSWLEWLGRGEGVVMIALPITTYVLTMQFFAWLSYYYINQLFITLVCCCSACVFAFASVPRDAKAGVKTKFKAVSVLLALVMGAYVGWHVHLRFVRYYYASKQGERYTNVLPVQSASSHSDAAIIDFANSAYVMLGEAIAFHPITSAHRYCVAPILEPTQTNDVQFWAVGTDCCDVSDGFKCDAAGKAADLPAPEPNRGPHSGVRVFDLGTLETDADHYRAAIRMAESNSELRGADDAILVRWVLTPDVDATIAEHWHTAHVWLFVASVLGSLPLAAGAVVASRAFRKWLILI